MSATDIGPLDWRIAITDKNGRPTPEFQRRWNTQRVNNGLIGSVTLGSGIPTGTPDDGAEYIDTSTTPYTLYVGNGGVWKKVGVVNFTDLQDAPHSYTSQGLKLVRVKSDETGIEFVASAALAANPTATASDTVVNGSASTFMRSDAAPAVQLATTSQFGLVKPDGTTITVAGGVISSAGGGGGGGVVSARYWRIRGVRGLTTHTADGMGMCLVNFRNSGGTALIVTPGLAGFANVTDTAGGWAVAEAFNGSSASGNGWFSGTGEGVISISPYLGYDFVSNISPASVEFAPLTGFLWSPGAIVAVDYSLDKVKWFTLTLIECAAGTANTVVNYTLPSTPQPSGTYLPLSGGTLTGNLQVNSTDVGVTATGGQAAMTLIGDLGARTVLTSYNSAVAFPAVRLNRARGTITSPALVQTGDGLGSFNFLGWTGSGFTNAAAFQVVVVEPGTVSPTAIGTEFHVNLMKRGSGTLSAAFSIDPDLGLALNGRQVTDANGFLIGQVKTVAQLNALTGIVAYTKAFASDALSPIFGATVTGGGAVKIPVYYDGAAWKVG